MKLRREVRRFAEAMETRLQRHDATRGKEWLTMTPRKLRGRLAQELQEFRGAMDYHGNDWPAIRDEAADAANFLMFIVEVLGRRTTLAKPEGA